MRIDFRVVPPFSEYATAEEARRVFLEGYMAVYGDTYGEDMHTLQTTVESTLADMAEAQIDYAVLQGEWELGDYRKMNDAVYDMARKYSDKFPVYFLGLDPGRNDNMPKVIEREVKERGFSGVNIQSWSTRLCITDRAWGPVYAKCQELGIPITIHTSINFTVDRPIGLGRPLHISEVAAEFPDLVIVANHAGWPWVNEMVGVAWKHRNVYIEIGAQSPKYMSKPGTGWDPLMVFGNSVLQDKVLFATDCMLPAQRVVKELLEAPLKDSVKEKWLGLNAQKLIERIKN
ncbi:MAG: amidohydrolase [Hyphomicrobiales bacterium]|nr:amidohydrolase [Hyphomicrobiales bacterium]MCP5370255.1 amidohydrolase [Hyphomicrobiales bacterium]